MTKKLIVVLGPESEDIFAVRKELMSFATKRFNATCERMNIIFVRATHDGEPVTEETANDANGYAYLDGKVRKEPLPKNNARTILVGCKSQWGFNKAVKVIPYGNGRASDLVKEFIDRDLPALI